MTIQESMKQSMEGAPVPRALMQAKRRQSELDALLPMIGPRLGRRDYNEALRLLADGIEFLEAGALFTFHLPQLDSVLALAAVAVELCRSITPLEDRARALLARAVALRLGAVTGNA